MHEVWGGGGAEGAEAMEEAEDEEDEGFFGGGEADVGRKNFEGALLEGAAEVEALIGGEAAEDGWQAEVEATAPGGAEGQDAGQDGVRFLGPGTCAGDGDGGAAEGTD